MLISVAMLGASVYAGATNLQERTGANPDLPSADSIYETALALIASNFSVFPVMLLYALAKHDGHRKWLHRSVLFLLWGLSVTVVYLAPRGEVDYTLRKSGQRNFECDQRGSQYWHVVKATQFLVIGLPLLWLVLTVFITTGFKIPGMVDKPWVKRWRSMWRLMIAWINMLIMWGILAYFTYFRQKIIDAADGLDKNDKWTFGQVLALAAWAPILAEIFYILAFN
ncbi:C6 zinc finger domain containing protein [Colletotrichum tofieldiae]|nr:C6 zinc finger domain containing protein [Colletotrichum tofieldiae]